jgi:hypothetical protein
MWVLNVLAGLLNGAWFYSGPVTAVGASSATSGGLTNSLKALSGSVTGVGVVQAASFSG